MGGNASRIMNTKGYPQLTKLLKESEVFKSGSLTVHNNLNKGLDSLYDDMHKSAMGDDLKEEDEQRNPPIQLTGSTLDDGDKSINQGK